MTNIQPLLYLIWYRIYAPNNIDDGGLKMISQDESGSDESSLMLPNAQTLYQ